jgi:hypothetical protein
MHHFARSAVTIGGRSFVMVTAMRSVVCDGVTKGLPQEWEEAHEARPF